MDYNKKSILSEELFQIMVKDKKVRTAITKKSHKHFFHFYFAHYITYQTAPFHDEIFSVTEDESQGNFFVVAFRGSGKSTLVTTSFPIWAILGEQQKKFALILCQTQSQAKQHMMNLRRELESNELLKNDLGPFQEESSEWGSVSLVFSNSNSRITVASSEQSIRGLRHGAHRPDLIICDDVEDINSTKTQEGRNKTYNWFKSEVIPCGDKKTRVVVVGNLLHEDSLLMRIKEDIDNQVTEGKFLKFPLVDDNGICLWPGKLPTPADVEAEKKKIGNEIAWQREYLLRIIPSDDQVVDPKIIQYYDFDKLPSKHIARRGTYASVDLAISQKDSADYTAVVSAVVFGRADKLRIYILPNPTVKKISFPQQLDLLREYNNNVLTGEGDKLFVEAIGYQDALPQMLETVGISAIAVKPTTDKRTRLALTVPMIQSGRVKFPRTGAEDIIRQIVGFGVEKHDDIADAFSMLVNQVSNMHSQENTWIMAWLGGNTIYYSDYVDVEI
jgi:predicted phage terminase large subunit-like protein